MYVIQKVQYTHGTGKTPHYFIQYIILGPSSQDVHVAAVPDSELRCRLTVQCVEPTSGTVSCKMTGTTREAEQ